MTYDEMVAYFQGRSDYREYKNPSDETWGGRSSAFQKSIYNFPYLCDTNEKITINFSVTEIPVGNRLWLGAEACLTAAREDGRWFKLKVYSINHVNDDVVAGAENDLLAAWKAVNEVKQ